MEAVCIEAGHTAGVDGDGERIKQLKVEILEMRLHGRSRRIALGRKLIELRTLIELQGSRTFLQVVRSNPPEGLGIPQGTAYDYIHEAEDADSYESYENRNNEAALEEPLPSEADLADPEAERVAAVKADWGTQVAQLKGGARVSSVFRVDFVGVTPYQRSQVRDRIKELGLPEAFALFYRALCSGEVQL
jgi:hypothetical protein